MIEPVTNKALLAVCAEIRSEYPMIGGGLIDNHLPTEDPAWYFARIALGYVQSRASTKADMQHAMEAFAMVSLDFLRLQARFMRTGEYAMKSAEALVSDLYEDESKMRGYYLDGLAMTYALWPNHARMLQFFVSDFIPQVVPGSRVLEVGVGHGLLTALLFDKVPGISYVGVDISPSSLDYAAHALAELGVEGERVRMIQANAVEFDLGALADNRGFEALICCEVLEHVDTPHQMMANLLGALAPGSRAFVSTVANMEAEDHVFLFDDVDAIRDLISDTGWEINKDLANVLPGAESWDPLPVNYSAVLSRSVGQHP